MAEEKTKINLSVIILAILSAILGGFLVSSAHSNKLLKLEKQRAYEIFNTETGILTEMINIKEDTIQYLRAIIATNDEDIEGKKKQIAWLRYALDTISIRTQITSTSECFDFVAYNIPNTGDSTVHLISSEQACAIADSLYELTYLRVISSEQLKYEDMLITGINDRDELVLRVSEKVGLTEDKLKLSETLRGEIEKQNKKLARKLRIRTWTFGGATVGLLVLLIAK